MSKEFENRLATLEEELRQARVVTGNHRQFKPPSSGQANRKLRVTLAAIGMILFVAIGALIYAYYSNPTFPSTIGSSLSFPIYYPSKLPPNFKYVNQSAKVEGGLLTYDLSDGSNTITIAIQSLPKTELDLNIIDGLKAYKTSIGTAYIGKQKETIAAIVVADRSLINISSSSSISTQTLGVVAQNLHEIK